MGIGREFGFYPFLSLEIGSERQLYLTFASEIRREKMLVKKNVTAFLALIWQANNFGMGNWR